MRGRGILIDDSLDLMVKPVRDVSGKIVSGLVLGNTLYQNQALILLIHPGELKSNPVTGVGISGVVLDTDYLGWRRNIRKQMELDGQQVFKIVFSANENLEIDAKYRNS